MLFFIGATWRFSCPLPSRHLDLRLQESERRRDVKTDTKMTLVAEAWVPSDRDHGGTCRAVGSCYAKSSQKFPRRFRVQIADCCAFNEHGNGSGPPCIGRQGDEQRRTAMIGVVEAVAKQALKLGPLPSVTSNIKPELAIADDNRAAAFPLLGGK
jgi:hypothetical protein